MWGKGWGRGPGPAWAVRFAVTERQNSGVLLLQDEGHHPWQEEQFSPSSAPALPPNGLLLRDSQSPFTAPRASVRSASKLRVNVSQRHFITDIIKLMQKQKERPPVLGPRLQHL